MVDDTTLAVWSRAFIALHVAAALLLVCALYAPKVARAALGIGFAVAAVINLALALGVLEPWPLVDGPSIRHPAILKAIAWPIALWQLACAASLLGKGTARAGAFGAMLFLIFIAPFTSSIAFPATFAIGAVALLVAENAARDP